MLVIYFFNFDENPFLMRKTYEYLIIGRLRGWSVGAMDSLFFCLHGSASFSTDRA